MSYITDLFTTITTPSEWMRNYPTSKAWDARLNKLMKKHKFVRCGAHSAMLGKQMIWIGNHPYASFSPDDMNVLPSRATVRKAFKKLLEDLTEEETA